MPTTGKKTKLMYYIGGLHHGGAERVVASLCRNLDADRYDLTVCWRSAIGKIGEDLKNEGFRLVGLPDVAIDTSPYKRFLALKKVMANLEIDIIHTHDRGSLADAAQCKLLGSRAKLAHTFHFGNYPNVKKSHLAMDRLFSRFANVLIAVGFEQAKAIRRALFLRSNALRIVYNGVESPSPGEVPEILPEDLRQPDRPTVIASISTLTEQKGLFDLLSAAALLREMRLDCVFVLAGDGPLRELLEQRVEDLNLTGMVRFLGWVPDAANALLPSIDIFCQSSHWEANSIVLLEAMAFGKPIVTTNVGESRHVIDDDRCGRIVPPRDPEKLAMALADLVRDREGAAILGQGARDKFEASYTIENMTREHDSVYEELLK